MRGALHVVATQVLVPCLVLAAAFLILGHTIGAGPPWNKLATLLGRALWIVPWGAIGFAVVIVAIAVLGPLDAGQLPFLVPCLVALGCAGWLAFSARPAAAVGG